MANLRIQPIKTQHVRFGIEGTSPLVTHNWSEKALRMLRMTAAERRKVPKTARNPEEEAEAATYRTSDGSYGFPLLGLKAAIISAAHKDLGIEKTLVKKSMFFADEDGSGYIPIEADEPVVREDIVRVGVGQTDLRYRPEFAKWRATVTIELDTNALSAEDVINLVNRAGFGIGLCEWRPEKGGEFGRFRVDTSVPVEVLST